MNEKTQKQGNMSWQNLLIAYLDFKSLRSQSSHNYRRYVKSFTRFFDSEFTNIDSINHEKVSSFRNYILNVRNCKNTTWNNYCRHFKAMMRFGIDHGLITQKKIHLIRCFSNLVRKQKRLYHKMILIFV
ncbi:phage integrase SAM-like domain-containing protein [Gilliamella sp. B2776]|uniref:phage integrase SAM-like domain-containing protein n=2 Tax=unclassified Gilliamella TaxID=2685620 RepID=UPI0027A302CA|nr:phage integrase SAM-like domain-containing protein [Gilliamella sp. B2717]MCX8649563.1 phage integrase SAM-like domain-containing protein [Gilliamella sp. B2779]MCX8653877.1 phage integrase SAM-like domain-containing protein [Gilliamella sp. B2737]MCX8691447.1 phage integrase SAM-like domain-containing protein [Gilliamella sp. B2776]MCX8702492.1 phage integrase SAM-like domain-containing protein [Gilliamella sp. B2781]MCX8727169.1 phage integrase SAM-like domain-containing protein [Gilliame